MRRKVGPLENTVVKTHRYNLLKIVVPEEGHRGEPRRILSRRSSVSNALQNPSISSPNCCLDLQLLGPFIFNPKTKADANRLKRCSPNALLLQTNCYVDVGQVG